MGTTLCCDGGLGLGARDSREGSATSVFFCGYCLRELVLWWQC